MSTLGTFKFWTYGDFEHIGDIGYIHEHIGDIQIMTLTFHMVWHGLIWFGKVWYGSAWFGMV